MARRAQALGIGINDEQASSSIWRRARRVGAHTQNATDAARVAAPTTTRRGLRERDLRRGAFGGGASGENAYGERRGVRRVGCELAPPVGPRQHETRWLEAHPSPPRSGPRVRPGSGHAGMSRVSLTTALDSVSACIGRPIHNSSPHTYNPASPRCCRQSTIDHKKKCQINEIFGQYNRNNRGRLGEELPSKERGARGGEYGLMNGAARGYERGKEAEKRT
ncbi:hypothetical protein DFH09DRAFT_1105598 [Mycena vulgaris]|nr:hypothetical protein DFH09DRAFT_1105598 [Mycena vulgaris]